MEFSPKKINFFLYHGYIQDSPTSEKNKSTENLCGSLRLRHGSFFLSKNVPNNFFYFPLQGVKNFIKFLPMTFRKMSTP